MQQFIFALGVTAPILLLVLLGVFLRRINLIDESFLHSSNKLVFNVALPALLFLGVYHQPINAAFDAVSIGYSVAFSVVSVLAMIPVSRCFAVHGGAFVQAAFRGNLAIIGMALFLNTFGSDRLAVVGIYVGLLTIVYNILGIFCLGGTGLAAVRRMVTNPLIIAIVLGIAWGTLQLPMPAIGESIIQYLSNLTIPLALLCIGGSLRWHSVRDNMSAIVWASCFKLIILPLVATMIAVVLGLRDEQLGLVYLMMSAPTAAAAYVMARQWTDSGSFTAEVIAMTTLGFSFTVTIGLIVLRTFGLL